MDRSSACCCLWWVAATIFYKGDVVWQDFQFCKKKQSFGSEIRQRLCVQLAARKTQRLKTLKSDIQRVSYDVLCAFYRKIVNLAVFRLNLWFSSRKSTSPGLLTVSDYFDRTKCRAQILLDTTPGGIFETTIHSGTEPLRARKVVYAHSGSCPLRIEFFAFTIQPVICD